MLQRWWILDSYWLKVSINFLNPFGFVSCIFSYPFCGLMLFMDCLTLSNITEEKRFLTEISAEQSYGVCSRRVKLSVKKLLSAVITLIAEWRHDLAGCEIIKRAVTHACVSLSLIKERKREQDFLLKLSHASVEAKILRKMVILMILMMAAIFYRRINQVYTVINY